MADEPDPVRGYGMGAGVGVNLNELAGAKAQVDAMAGSVKGLESSLRDFGNNAYNIAEKINRHLKSIGDTAASVSGQLSGMTNAVAGVGGGGRGGGGAGGGGAGTPPSSVSPGSGGSANWISSASQAINRVTNKEMAGGLSLGTFVGTGDDFAKDLMLAPLRYLRSRINTNRETAIMASGGLNMQAMQQGTTTAGMMSTMARFPGSIYGNPTDLLQMFGAAPSLGASFGFGGQQGQGVRAQGFLKGVREMQMMNPMAAVGGEGGLVGQLGGYSADTGAQQRAQMLTGGAMGMIAVGGRQKSLSEWAESILRWFEGLRPGGKRGKGFDYGELMAQYFPGSNIDAWFQTTGVPQNMRDYWWTYALAKANKTADTTSKNFQIGVDENNVAWQRLRAGSELTRTEFGLAGQMAPQYAQRESSNRWFNQLMGQMQQSVIPAITNSNLFGWIQFLPDAIEDLMMTGAERGMSELIGGGDIGDVGIGDSYGAMGGTGLSGLHPDMKSKVGRMMQANPKLRVNSGLRDTGLQKRLKDKGFNRVSGKPSAHTRGMAADLGPKSEYKWIAKNAGRFGLASGKGHGEPWHVGMKGDIPGVGDIGDTFDDFIDSVKGFGSSPEGMASFITKILSTMTGGLGKLLGGGSDQSFGAGISPDALFDRLVGASQKTTIGLKPASIFGAEIGGGSVGGVAAGTGTGWSADGKTWMGTSASGRGDRYNQVASPDIMADIQSGDAVTRGTAVAKVLHQAGFRGEALRNFLKISYRESHWTANAWNGQDPDRSGGILQANQLPWTKKGQPSPFTQADLMDPLAAAHVAYDQYKNVAPVNGPGGSNTYSPWSINGDPFKGIPPEASGLAETVLKQTGLGDIEAMSAGISLMNARQSGAGVNFNNTFHLAVPTYGSGGSGGIDVRRTVALIADHLEDEMTRRMKRSA